MSITVNSVDLPSSFETSKLGVFHLRRYFYKNMAKKNGLLRGTSLVCEHNTDVALLSVLGLGLEQTLKYVYGEGRSFEEFEDWILSVNDGSLQQERIDQFNAEIKGERLSQGKTPVQVLSAADLAMWEQQGYIIIRNAVPREDCEATVAMICDHIHVDLENRETWYDIHPSRQGIMVQLFQHPLLQKNRTSEKIRLAFEQLWGRTDIYLNTDRVGFNPPETDKYNFPGPYLHWDVSIEPPIPFGTQGILYLADTAANQGAFTLIPGFHHRMAAWMDSLPPGADPREQDLYALGATPIAANAGDFILWHQALPHGSSPNTAALPRFVQYLNYNPLNPEIADIWK
jgi:hypothetical protein